MLLPGTAMVWWLPFYHDWGSILGIGAIDSGRSPGVFTSPVGFWSVQPAGRIVCQHGHVFSAAPQLPSTGGTEND